MSGVRLWTLAGMSAPDSSHCQPTGRGLDAFTLAPPGTCLLGLGPHLLIPHLCDCRWSREGTVSLSSAVRDLLSSAAGSSFIPSWNMALAFSECALCAASVLSVESKPCNTPMGGHVVDEAAFLQRRRWKG